jgi:predicted Zn-dependent protease with MMP-like domain
MPLSDWLGGRRKNLREQVLEALADERTGESGQVLARFRGRYSEALAELEQLGGVPDVRRLWLKARLEYRAGLMEEAMETLGRLVRDAASDAGAWHLSGRVGLWLSDAGAEEAFERAARLDPRRYVRPHRVGHDHFAALAERALAGIPEQFQALLGNTMIVVDDLPTLESVREGEDPDLLGIYEGATVLSHGLPERIVLYQRNHENVSADERELRNQVVETMRHEIGHHFGMEEEELPY